MQSWDSLPVTVTHLPATSGATPPAEAKQDSPVLLPSLGLLVARGPSLFQLPHLSLSLFLPSCLWSKLERQVCCSAQSLLHPHRDLCIPLALRLCTDNLRAADKERSALSGSLRDSKKLRCLPWGPATVPTSPDFPLTCVRAHQLSLKWRVGKLTPQAAVLL